ncbi:MAG: ribosome biogenesis GTPase YlqF [Bacillota bacterium]
MEIQWYPGHMAKAKRLLSEQLKLIDIVLELRDARIPISSSNPDLADLLRLRQRIVVLNKADLADQKGNMLWVDYLVQNGKQAIALSSHSREINKLSKMIEQAADENNQARSKKGINPRAQRIMVVGIPNVGKSTLINSLIGKSRAVTANKPGVTRGNQWYRVGRTLELLDTPGLLWPKFTGPDTGFMLALTGSVRQEIYERVEVAQRFLKMMQAREVNILEHIYDIKDLSENRTTSEQLQALGKRWGFLKAGGLIDLEKTADRLLLEFRKGKLGKLTLEYPSS